MNMNSKCVTIICRMAVLIGLFVVPSGIGAQNAATQAQPDHTAWKTTPMHIELEPSDPGERALRQRRNAAANDKTGTWQRLDLPQDKSISHGSGPPFRVRIPALPFKESHTVVVATITGFTPYFSDDRTSIYTELQVKVEAVIKADKPVTVGQQISIAQLGGSLKLPSGKVVRQFAPDDEQTLELGHKYLLFLSYFQELDYYSVVKTWDLHGGLANPRAVTDARDAQNGTSRYAGMAEADFLREVQRCRDSGPTSNCDQK